MSASQFCATCGDETPRSPCVHCGADPRLGGRYVLREMLGQGSHGMTWRAEDPRGQVVAIKVINLGRGLSQEGGRALDREVAVLRQLSHPQIPGLRDDFSVRSGMTRYRCIVQDFVDGKNLLQELADTRHTAAQVMETVARIADILDHLHTLTPPIIHRDIKPQNILRRRDGTLTLIDFGSVRDTLVGTMGGTMSVGTVGYMAPEQITGNVHPGSDLYALGALAVHLLTRQPPRLTHDPDDPIRWRKPPGLAPGIGALVDDLLQPSLSKRPSSAAEVARRARRLAEGRPEPVPPKPVKAPAVPARRPKSTPATRSHAPLVVLYSLFGSTALVVGISALVIVEVALVAGLVLAVVGPVMTFLALRRRQWLGAVLGLSAPAAVAVLGGAYLLGFSLASGPFSALLAAVAGLMILSAALALGASARTRRQQAATQPAGDGRSESERWREKRLDSERKRKRGRGKEDAKRYRKSRPKRSAFWGGSKKKPQKVKNSFARVKPDPPLKLKRVMGTDRERDVIKEIARDWRSGVVPEEQHHCPFCGDRVSHRGLVRHYDKVHKHLRRSRKRQRQRS